MATQVFQSAYHISDGSMSLFDAEPMEDIIRDPRGLLLMWEPPIKAAKYVMGMDTAEGITGWNRGIRTEDDHKIDNSVLEIFRVDAIKEYIFTVENGVKRPVIDPATRKQRIRYMDLQVAEFAAPCDPVECAKIANILGWIYAGDSEDQCELIWEAWPGCGLLATQELVRLGYHNLWQWEYMDTGEATQRLGWYSTRESMKALWYQSRRHMMGKKALIQSRYLLDEYSNAEIDVDKMRARAAYGFHDDRFTAANLAFWAAHRWTQDIQNREEVVTQAPSTRDYQNYAPTLDDCPSYQDWKDRQLEALED